MRFAVRKMNPGRQNRTIVLTKGKPSRPASESSYVTTLKTLEILYENDRNFENCTYEIYKRTVMIKPSLPRPLPELGSSNMMNTDPQACRAVVDWLIEKEVKRVVLAESNPWAGVDPWAVCGYRDVFAKSPYKGIVDFIELGPTKDEDLVEVDYKMARDFYTDEDLAFLKGFIEGREGTRRFSKAKIDFDLATSTTAKFNKALKEASVLVNLSKMKTHVQTGASLAVKNHFAFLEPAESRYAKHLGMDPFQGNFTYQELILSSLNLQRSVSCVAAAFRTLRIPELCVVDGVISQEGNGPLEHGKPREEHVVAAAWNCPATIDAVLSTGFMGLRAKGGPYLPPHIQWASGLGLGTREMEEICLILAREDGIPASSINEVRNSPAESFALPATMKGGCAPKVYPRDTLLPVMTRALDELQSEGIDPNRALPIVRKKLVAPAGIISG